MNGTPIEGMLPGTTSAVGGKALRNKPVELVIPRSLPSHYDQRVGKSSSTPGMIGTFCRWQTLAGRGYTDFSTLGGVIVRIVARQIWWWQVVRITIGCAVVALGVLTPWIAVLNGPPQLRWRALCLLIPGGITIALLGTVFAVYARLEWRPRGFAVAMTRRGLILKANGFRCPKLVVIKWARIRSATYEPPVTFSVWPGRVKIFLHECLANGTLPTNRGGVVKLGPFTIGLNGRWEQWHPEDVANLIHTAANDPAVRAAL